MNITNCRDGIPRADVRVTFRNQMARECAHKEGDSNTVINGNKS
ncbi:hypothetical protein [Saccharopolyspora soli]|nr:hypothetical protein [Saccharopolyspora soli]